MKKWSKEATNAMCGAFAPCTAVAMQVYHLPGYELQLLGELQRQQTCSLFCDTLLQSEGISIPTHSCVLAAFSPYLSERLLMSPPPSLGQKRQLRLHSVKADTLLKFVGLFYSGKLEVRGGVEQREVLAAAQQFGIRNLRKTDEINTEEEYAKNRVICRNQLLQEGIERVSGRKIDAKGEMPPSLPQTLHEALSNQLSNITPAEQYGSATCIPFHRTHETNGDVHSKSPNTMAECSNATLTGTDLLSKRTMATGIYQHSPVNGNNTDMSAKCKRLKSNVADDDMTANFSKAQQQAQASREDIRKLTTQSSAPDMLTSMGMSNMKMMMDMEHISVKMKLRRTRKDEVWEVVRMPDSDERSLAVASLNEDACALERLPSFVLQPHQIPSLNTTTPNHGSTDPQTPFCDPYTPNRSSKSASPVKSHLLTEDPEKQMEKILEDIMMAVNTLPNLNPEENNESLSLGPIQGETSDIFQILEMEEGRSAAQIPAVTECCAHSQGCNTGGCDASTGICQCFGAAKQTSCSDLASLPADALPVASIRDAPLASGTCGQQPQYIATLESSSRAEQASLSQQNEEVSLPSPPFMDTQAIPRCLSPLDAPVCGEKSKLGDSGSAISEVCPDPPSVSPPGKTPSLLLHFLTSPLLPVPNTQLRGLESPVRCKKSLSQKEQAQEHFKVTERTDSRCSKSCPQNGVGTQKTKSPTKEIVAENEINLRKSTRVKLQNKRAKAGHDDAEQKKRRGKSLKVQQANSPCLVFKEEKESDAGMSAKCLSACSVRLLSNNVLAKGRKMAICSGNEFRCADNSLTGGPVGNAACRRGGRSSQGAHINPVSGKRFWKKKETVTDTMSNLPGCGATLSSVLKRCPPQKVKPQGDPPHANENCNKDEMQPAAAICKVEKPRNVSRRRKRNETVEEVVVPKKFVKDESPDTAVAPFQADVKKPRLTPGINLQNLKKHLRQKRIKTRKIKEKWLNKHMMEALTNAAGETVSTQENLTVDLANLQNVGVSEAPHYADATQAKSTSRNVTLEERSTNTAGTSGASLEEPPRSLHEGFLCGSGAPDKTQLGNSSGNISHTDRPHTQRLQTVCGDNSILQDTPIIESPPIEVMISKNSPPENEEEIDVLMCSPHESTLIEEQCDTKPYVRMLSNEDEDEEEDVNVTDLSADEV